MERIFYRSYEDLFRSGIPVSLWIHPYPGPLLNHLVISKLLSISHLSDIPSLSLSSSEGEVILHFPKTHDAPDSQSPSALQVWPMPHLSGQTPPQSTSPSPGLNLLSEHSSFFWHFRLLHARSDSQSEFDLHSSPSLHALHLFPPQSTSVSFPLCIASLHVG